MPSPLTVGVLALMATVITIIEWVVMEPAFHSMEAIAMANVNDTAVPLIQTLHYTCYLLPIGITLCLWVWAFFAVTRRQPVTGPSY